MIKYAIPVKMDNKGRVTVPKRILDETKLTPGKTEVIIVYDDSDKSQIIVKENNYEDY